MAYKDSDDGFEPRTPAHDGVWFLIEPAVTPFPCTEEQGKMWYRMPTTTKLMR
jgi:hypothetical protein